MLAHSLFWTIACQASLARSSVADASIGKIVGRNRRDVTKMSDQRTRVIFPVRDSPPSTDSRYR